MKLGVTCTGLCGSKTCDPRIYHIGKWSYSPHSNKTKPVNNTYFSKEQMTLSVTLFNELYLSEVDL